MKAHFLNFLRRNLTGPDIFLFHRRRFRPIRILLYIFSVIRSVTFTLLYFIWIFQDVDFNGRLCISLFLLSKKSVRFSLFFQLEWSPFLQESLVRQFKNGFARNIKCYLINISEKNKLKIYFARISEQIYIYSISIHPMRLKTKIFMVTPPF